MLQHAIPNSPSLEHLTTAVRGVVRIGADCPHCARPVPVFGAVGKGRSLDLFTPGYFCRGHATTTGGTP